MQLSLKYNTNTVAYFAEEFLMKILVSVSQAQHCFQREFL